MTTEKTDAEKELEVAAATLRDVSQTLIRLAEDMRRRQQQMDEENTPTAPGRRKGSAP